MNKAIEEVFDIATRAGIELTVNIEHPDGFQPINLDPVSAMHYLESPDIGLCHFFQVTKNHLNGWRELLANPQCYHSDDTGRCPNTIAKDELPVTPDQYDPNKNYYCEDHK